MVITAARRRLAAWRQPARVIRLARVLWTVWAVVVWNVVFDHVIVVAGRRYIGSAATAATTPGTYARLDDWMGPAVGRALWTASVSAAAILLVGLALIACAAARGSD
jgi:hypothetical protein